MKIKRCPICLGESRLIVVKRPEESLTGRLYYVQCKSCGLQDIASYTKETAIQRRNQETKLETACKRLIAKFESGESFQKEMLTVKDAIR